MTPSQALDDAKGRFIILYHDDEAALSRLLRQALAKFQDKAGVIREWVTDETAVRLDELPHFKAPALCSDSKRRYVPFEFDRKSESIELRPGPKCEAPYRIEYFADLRSWPDDEDLPADCFPLLTDYLEALIAVPNAERARYAMASTGIPYQELPSVQELRQRISDIEREMEDCKALIPSSSAF